MSLAFFGLNLRERTCIYDTGVKGKSNSNLLWFLTEFYPFDSGLPLTEIFFRVCSFYETKN